jgi:hypothetical protein
MAWRKAIGAVLAAALAVLPMGSRAQMFNGQIIGDAAGGDIYAHIRVAGFAQPVELRRSGLHTRIDLSAGGVLQTYIADREKGVLIAMTATGQNRLALVFPLDRAAAVVPLPIDLPVLAANATVKPVGAAMVAGRSCRLMEFSGYLGQAGMICVAADNLILQMTKQGRNEPLFQVTDLVVARQDAKWFRPPPDFQVTVVPAIGGASASGGGQGIVAPPKNLVKPQ